MPNSYIVIDNGIADDEQDCTIKPAWGAAICKGDFGHFSVGDNFSFGFGNGPITDPVMLSRNGRRWEYTGQTTIPSGADVRIETARKDLSLTLNEMDDGSWALFELPGFTTAAGGEEEASLDALRKAGKTAWFKDKDALWVKVVSNGDGARGATPGSGTSVEVSR